MQLTAQSNMKSICTIITKSHIHYAVALHQSIDRFIAGIRMHVLIVDDFKEDDINIIDGIDFYSVSSILDSKVGQGIYKKYYHKNMDHFRWSFITQF